MGRKRLIAVGACYIDTILSVPHYPDEDSKLRATTLSTRRGGNCPNTLEVLSQLVGTSNAELHLHLISVLPAVESQAAKFVYDSLNPGTRATVDLSRCVYRDGHTEAASSYIIHSEATGSRTIVNYNALPEMTAEEFREAFEGIISPSARARGGSGADGTGDDDDEMTWVHFEGRIPDVTRACIEYLRSRSLLEGKLVVSIECEKPDREGLQELAGLVDVAFYSRTWAEGRDRGYGEAAVCVREQARLVRQDRGKERIGPWLGLCTWGEAGVSALTFGGQQNQEFYAHSPATEVLVRDSVGAGDSFLAGILFGLICRNGWEVIDRETANEATTGDGQDWGLQAVLKFGNEVAGQKLVRQGFDRIGEDVEKCVGYG